MNSPINIVEIFRFLATGALNTAFGYAVFLICYYFFKFDSSLSLGITQIVGMSFNFLTYSKLVFTAAKNYKIADRILRYIISYAITYAVNLAILEFLISIGTYAYVAQAASLFIVVPTSYYLFKKLVWASASTQEMI